MANDKKQGMSNTELKDEIHSACMQMVNLLSPNLNLNLHDIVMNTAVLSELIDVLEHKGIISPDERKGMYRNAQQQVSSLKLAHFKRLGEIDKSKRDALEGILRDSEEC